MFIIYMWFIFGVGGYRSQNIAFIITEDDCFLYQNKEYRYF